MLFGWQVRRSAIMTTVIIAMLAVIFAAADLLAPYPWQRGGWEIWGMLPAFWIVCFVYGVCLDNTDKF